jgi:hypothetical protein
MDSKGVMGGGGGSTMFEKSQCDKQNKEVTLLYMLIFIIIFLLHLQ